MTFFFPGLNNSDKIEFKMINETQFQNLQVLQYNETDFVEQVYENVDGFESLRNYSLKY